MQSREFNFGEHRIPLPELPSIRVGRKAAAEVRRFARIVAESSLHSAYANPLSPEPMTPAQHAQFSRLFEEINHETGQFKDRRLADESEAAARKYRFVSRMSGAIVPGAHIRLMDKLKDEYAAFLSKHELRDTEQAYGVFMLGVQHEYASAVSEIHEKWSSKESLLHAATQVPDYLKNIRSRWQDHGPSPYDRHVPVSRFSKKGEPMAGDDILDIPSEQPFLDAVHVGSRWHTAMAANPAIATDPIQGRFRGVRLSKELIRIMRDYGLDA